MAKAETEAQGAAAATTEEAAGSLLEQAIGATKQTEREVAEDLLKTLTEQALAGTVTFSKNLTQTIRKAVAAIDAKISKQLAEIMHNPKFLQLEGSWRGLHHLVMNSETGQTLKIRVLNISKRQLLNDFNKATEFDQTALFKKIYENEFGSPGGEPYASMIGDYEFTNHPDDIDLLRGISGVAASAFAPFISAASPKLFELDDWQKMKDVRDLAMVFEGPKYSKWRSFRESEDSRFVTLTMPRSLARLPYGSETKPIDEFDYEEHDPGKALQHDHYCWMNTAYVMGTRLTDAFSKYGFCTAIRGAEGGGKVENLPTHTFQSDDGDLDAKCPTEVGITDRREKELSDLGFLPLCHYKNTDYAVFFGAQTTQKPKKYDRPEATANAAISARLPYMMATSRFAHYLKIMARDKIGSFMEVSDCEKWLNRWITNYVNGNENADAVTKARYPLREAKVLVQEVPGKPGSYNAVAYLRPWLQMEELTTSLRMVARIPQKA
ncbi:MAG: type VI secretion system contractile sheath large subunit [Alphaproteobacteria bacterium]|nr:type VI secretion system contractile sheath large subunit [Alphaproteobacteria bacterium]